MKKSSRGFEGYAIRNACLRYRRNQLPFTAGVSSVKITANLHKHFFPKNEVADVSKFRVNISLLRRRFNYQTFSESDLSYPLLWQQKIKNICVTPFLHKRRLATSAYRLQIKTSAFAMPCD
jgi:hypothetical protein